MCFVPPAATRIRNKQHSAAGVALHFVANWFAASAAFPMPASVYDLLIENCDEETATEEYELDISEATAYQIVVVALPAASPPEGHADAAVRL